MSSFGEYHTLSLPSFARKERQPAHPNSRSLASVSCPVCSASIHESVLNYHLDSGCPATASTSNTTSKPSTERHGRANKPTSQDHDPADVIQIPDDSPIKSRRLPLTSSSNSSTKTRAVVAPLFLGSTTNKRKRSTEEAPKSVEDEKQGLEDPFERNETASNMVDKKPRLDHLKAAQPYVSL
jgi:hypothetical protein